MSTKTATRKGAKTGKARKGITVSVISEALAAPKSVQQGKVRGFGSAVQDVKDGITVKTGPLHTLLAVFTIHSELGSWRIDAKTGAVSGGKARKTIQEFELMGMNRLEASLAAKRIYVEMGKLRNRYVDELKEIGIDARTYESTAKALKALVK